MIFATTEGAKSQATQRYTLGIYEPSVPERRPVLFSFKTYPGTEEDYQQLAKVAATLTFELNQQKDMTAAVAVFEYPFQSPAAG
ncbi:MAG: hypothetical protein U0939_21945 [Pirellulales bacterium]